MNVPMQAKRGAYKMSDRKSSMKFHWNDECEIRICVMAEKWSKNLMWNRQGVGRTKLHWLKNPKKKHTICIWQQKIDCQRILNESKDEKKMFANETEMSFFGFIFLFFCNLFTDTIVWCVSSRTLHSHIERKFFDPDFPSHRTRIDIENWFSFLVTRFLRRLTRHGIATDHTMLKTSSNRLNVHGILMHIHSGRQISSKHCLIFFAVRLVSNTNHVKSIIRLVVHASANVLVRSQCIQLAVYVCNYLELRRRRCTYYFYIIIKINWSTSALPRFFSSSSHRHEILCTWLACVSCDFVRYENDNLFNRTGWEAKQRTD